MDGRTNTSSFPPAVTALVVAVNAVALGALATLPTTGLERPGSLALLMLLAAVAGLKPVKLAFLDSKITASDPVVFATLGLLGPLPAVLASLAALFGSSLGRQQRPRPTHIFFNVGALSLATIAAGHVHLALSARLGQMPEARWLPLAMAALAHFLVNTFLTAAVVALHRRRNLLRVWGDCLWTVVSCATAIVLAIGMTLIGEAASPWILAFTLPALVPLAAYHQLRSTAAALSHGPRPTG